MSIVYAIYEKVQNNVQTCGGVIDNHNWSTALSPFLFATILDELKRSI